MFNILIMDPDNYIKKGLFTYLKSLGVNVMAVSNLSDLTINLKNNITHAVVMELFSRDDDMFSSIDFIRSFHLKWPGVHLVIYTQLKNEEAILLLKAVTGVNDIFYKNEPINKLASGIFSTFRKYQKNFMLVN